MRTSLRVFTVIGALVLVLPLLLLRGQPARGMQDAAATPTAVGIPGIDPSATAHLGGTIPGNPEIQLVKVAGGFSTPTNIAFPPDDSGRIFVVELDGRVHIINPDGSVEPEPFLDLTQVVSGRPGQQGLLGLAFHPKFAENGKFYVDYNDLYDNGAVTISEFTVDQDNPNLADPRTERPLMVIQKRSPLHNGGTLRFGKDGYLYISVGDGGWQGDVWDNAQNRFSLLGKILRIDVDRVGPAQPYGIPADNPFAAMWRSDNPYPGQPPVTQSENKKGKKQKRDRDWPGYVAPEYRNSLPPVRAEIWALGFRNPWQYAFDPANGDLYIGDVGADTWEEINYQPADGQAGQNYGWDWLEGTHCFPAEIESCPRQQVGILPIAEYEHGDDGCAVIALGVSRAPEDPTLDGIFFSGDFCTGEVRGLVRDEAGVWQFANMLDTALQISGSGQDDHGNIYMAATTGEPGDAAPGSVWRLMSADRVPEGAETVPLGQPRQGDIVIDGDYTGEPTDAAPGEEGAAAATPAAATQVAEAPQAAADGSMPSETIGMYDIYFEPRRIVIPANTDVRLILENKGEAPHSFDLKGQDVLVDVEPHTTADVVVNLPPGNYKFICDVPGHKQVGMNGALVVQ